MANQNIISIIIKAFGAKETADAIQQPRNACEQLGETIRGVQRQLTTFIAAVYSMRKAWEAADMAAQYQEQKTSLNALAAQYNTTSDTIISNVKDASRGLISLADAASVSAKGIMMGLNPEQLTHFMQIIEAMTNVTGQSVSQAFETITDAATRGNERTLAHMGILVDLQGTYKQYAASIGIAVTELNEQERQQAAINAVLEQGANIMDRLGGSADSVSDKMERFKVLVQDIKITVGDLIIKAGAGLIGAFHAIDMALVEMAEAAIKPFAIIEKGLNMIGVKSSTFQNIAETLHHTNEELYKGMMDSFSVMTSGAEEASQTQKMAVQDMNNTLSSHTERSGNDRRKWMEWEWQYADTVDKAGQEILDNIEKRDQAIKEHTKTLQAARESEIQLQLKEIDLAEQEFRMSKSGAVEERVRLYEELKRIQEEYLAGLDKVADPASWYAQMNAINQTREALVGLNLEMKKQTGTFLEGAQYGFQQYQHDAKTSFEYGTQAAQEAANAMQDSFSSISFDAMQNKLKTVGDYFQSFLTSLQRSVSNILGQLATRWIMMSIGAVPLFHKGGYIPRFHFGGMASDEVPAILQRGEYVVNRNAVSKVGRATLDKINNGSTSGGNINITYAPQYNLLDVTGIEKYKSKQKKEFEGMLRQMRRENKLR